MPKTHFYISDPHVNCPVLFGAGSKHFILQKLVLDMMAGPTQKELGHFLQDEIFDPYLRASCGVNLDRGGGQLGSNMSSSTATGKFEIVRLSDCQIVRHCWRVCWCISAHISRGQGDLAGQLCDPTISLSTHFCNNDSHAGIESSLDERVPPIDGRERSQVAVWSLSVWFEFSPGWTFCNDSLA